MRGIAAGSATETWVRGKRFSAEHAGSLKSHHTHLMTADANKRATGRPVPVLKLLSKVELEAVKGLRFEKESAESALLADNGS